MVAERKAALRQELRAARSALDPARRQAQVVATVKALLAYLAGFDAPVVASYAAFGSELDLGILHRQRWSAGACLLLPRAGSDRRLHWHPVANAGQLRPGYRGILEPDPATCRETVLDPRTILLVPGLGFTADGHRLGQGGGYYDSCLAQRRHHLAIGIGFSCQFLPEVPREAHDEVLDRVLIAGEWRR